MGLHPSLGTEHQRAASRVLGGLVFSPLPEVALSVAGSSAGLGEPPQRRWIRGPFLFPPATNRATGPVSQQRGAVRTETAAATSLRFPPASSSLRKHQPITTKAGE